MKEPLEPPSPSIKKAVALKYTPGESEAPIVVAKGSGCIADSILEKAKEHGVPVQEDAALVEVLSNLIWTNKSLLSSISWWQRCLLIYIKWIGLHQGMTGDA